MIEGGFRHDSSAMLPSWCVLHIVSACVSSWLNLREWSEKQLQYLAENGCKIEADYTAELKEEWKWWNQGSQIRIGWKMHCESCGGQSYLKDWPRISAGSSYYVTNHLNP